MKFVLMILLSLNLTSANAFDFKKLKKSLKNVAIEKYGKKAPKTLPKVGVCDASTTNGICYEFAGKDYKQKKKTKGNQFACKLLKGKYIASGNCPTVNRHGRCIIQKGKPDLYHLSYYKKGRLSSRRAKLDCRNKKSSLHRHGAGKWYKD